MEMEISLERDRSGMGLPLTFHDTEEGVMAMDPFAVPYESVLCLDVAFLHVERLAREGDAGISFVAKEILRRLAPHPELRGPIRDPALRQKHADIFELLLLFLAPPAERDQQLYKISAPFQIEPILISSAMRRLMDTENACYAFKSNVREVWRAQLAAVGCTILEQCYGVKVDFRPTAMLRVPDPQTGLLHFYKPTMDNRYLEVVVNGDLPPLSEVEIQEMLNNIKDTDLWLSRLPPEKFALHGFHFSELREVTEEESLSRLKHRLISRDAVLDVERVKELADLIRIHFQRPDLQLGLTAVDYPVSRTVNHEYQIRFNILHNDIERLTGAECIGSIYEQAFRSGELLLVSDLAALPKVTPVEQLLLDKGFRSILIAPLLNKEKYVIGLVELGSPSPYGLNAFMITKFEEIRRLFRTAVERSREYIDNRIEVILREQYTSLHPSVEWRFSEAAFRVLRRLDAGQPAAAEEIVFQDVYPLYGQADIVGSSKLRNAAIYQDLFDNLRAGRHFLVTALELVTFPIVNQVLLALDNLLTITAAEFTNSHEIRISDFIQQQLSPLIEQLSRQFSELVELGRQYQEKINPELGLFYRVRRDYELSVSTLNTMLSDFFAERDQAAQRVLPHYFEKYKTDGVEYELYAGQSLLKEQEFSDIHLRNLRLSQLVDMCDVTRRVDQLSETLPMPIRTAQLVFAYTTPIDIRFRMDEKRFDVDGDYNVRYEILKKRIDKATIGGGAERLTQPGMVSIVYLTDRDEQEYADYFNYLQQAGYLAGEVEYLVLDALQSVNGLRAMRFRVKS